MIFIKRILEDAIYHLRFERKNLTKDIERERETIEISHKIIDKKVLRLTEIRKEIEEVLAAADGLEIVLEIRGPL